MALHIYTAHLCNTSHHTSQSCSPYIVFCCLLMAATLVGMVPDPCHSEQYVMLDDILKCG